MSLGRSSRPSTPDAHGDDRAVDQLVAVLELREHHDLERGLEVLEDEDGHELALLRPLLLQVRDHAADPLHGAVGGIAELAEGAVDAPAQRDLGTHERMVGDVEPEHLLLEGQALHLVELVGRDGRPFVDHAALELTEERHDAHVVFATAGDRVVDDAFEHRQQALAAHGRASRTPRP